MYVYTALNNSGSGIYHRYKSILVLFSENLFGREVGKGKGGDVHRVSGLVSYRT